MAQKSRFRTTSGPTTNRAQKFKKNSGRDDTPGSGSSFKKKNSFSDRKAPYKTAGGSSKPFVKKEFKDKDDSAPRSSNPEKKTRDFSDKKGSLSDKKGPFKSYEDKRKPFIKKDFKDKDSSPRSFGENKNSKEYAERKPKSFSREAQSEREARKGPPDYSDKERPVGKDLRRTNFDDGKNNPSRSTEKKFFGKRPRTDKPYEESVLPGDDLIRLNRFISNSGICSRREADEMITMGLITVNGQSVVELGYKVKRSDDVRHDGKRLKAEKPVYILLNKPKGFITTTDDPQERNTVMQLINGACKERVYPVGRLDRNTSGLLLLTNDGDLTEKLSHPKHNVKKIYKAELDRPITKADFQKIVDGVRLEEGKVMVDDVAIVGEDGKTIGLEIHIGWNRVVRRLFEAIGYDVVKLDRSVYATLDKKDLSRGHWRFLRQDEVIRLKHFQ